MWDPPNTAHDFLHKTAITTSCRDMRDIMRANHSWLIALQTDCRFYSEHHGKVEGLDGQNQGQES